MDWSRILGYIIAALFFAFLFGYDSAKRKIIKKMYAKRIDYMTDRTIDKLYLINCYLPSKFQITAAEKENFDIILNNAIEYWRRAFEKENLKNSYKFAAQEVKSYFYFRIYEYLKEHAADGFYYNGDQNIEMRKFIKENEHDTIYSLTDFGLTFYKMLYATEKYNEEHGGGFQTNSAYTMTCIETKIVSFWRYRR